MSVSTFWICVRGGSEFLIPLRQKVQHICLRPESHSAIRSQPYSICPGPDHHCKVQRCAQVLVRNHPAQLPRFLKMQTQTNPEIQIFLGVAQSVRQTEAAQGRELTAVRARHRGSHPPPLWCDGKHPVRNTLCIWAFLELIICKR